MSVTSIRRALIAGVAGTVVMTVFSYVSHYLQLPKTDFHGMIASHLKTGTFVTWGVYFGFGIVLAYLYGTFFRGRLPAHSWGRGMIYATVLWAFMGVVLMPVFGMGFFGGSMAAAAAAFVTMGLYGATVGYLYEH